MYTMCDVCIHMCICVRMCVYAVYVMYILAALHINVFTAQTPVLHLSLIYIPYPDLTLT